METIETHLVEEETHVYLTKVDLKKREDEVTGFKVTCYDRVVECDLSKETPSVLVRKLTEEDRQVILKKGYSNVGKNGPTRTQNLEKRYTQNNEDIEYISTLLKELEFVFLQLKKMGHIPK